MTGRGREPGAGHHRRLVACCAVAATLALLVSACSESGSESADTTTSTTSRSPTPTTAGSEEGGTEENGTSSAPRTCDRPVEEAPAVEPVADEPDDLTMTTFDDSKIRLHWYPTEGASKEEPAPTILQGPGWGWPGPEDDPGGPPFFGGTTVHGLRTSGYNVLTWDPRGFGKSTGTVTVDGPDEVRDVERMLDWLATRPEVRLDAAGDPRAGMVGDSYGGGIQLSTAAADCRIDAIVPSVAWHSLTTSLYRNDTFKQGWSNFLASLATGRQVDPHMTAANAEGNATGHISAANVEWLTERGPGDAVGRITAPTLIVQGTVDTLFTLDEAIANYEALEDAGTPVSMIWFCGGHGDCETKAEDGDAVSKASLAWLDRYVRGNVDAEVPSGFSWIEADGTSHEADGWPLTNGRPLTGRGTGRLPMSAIGGAGPGMNPTAEGMPSRFVESITPTKATNAVDIEVPVEQDATVVGAPELELTYTATLPDDAEAPRPPDHIFAQVLNADGIVVGHQITPVPVTFDGKAHTTTVVLETIATPAKAGSSFTVQLVAVTPAYHSTPVGTVEVAKASVELPTVTDFGGGADASRT